MKIMVKTLGLALATVMMLPAASWAQGMGQQQGSGAGMGANKQNPPATGQQGQTGQQAAPATPPAAPKIDPAEEAAFKKITTTPTLDPKTAAQNGEDFLKKYPTSIYVGRVDGLLAGAYMQLNDPAKAQAAGLKSLADNPNNVDALAVLAVVMSRSNMDTSQPGAAQRLQDAEKYARTGIDQLTALQKPADQTDADFNKLRDSKLAMCYSGLGLVEYSQNKAADAALQFSEAVKRENPPEPVDQYLLGMALMDNKQYAGAVTAFQDCLKDPGPMQQRCSEGLKDSKQKAAAQPTPPKQ
jgi:tetratricopeptide (TPR) repeat protein